MTTRPEDRHDETDAIHIRTVRSGYREHASPIYLTSSFTFDDAEQARALFARETEGHIYSRYGNPNLDEFVEKMCRLEEAEDGVATASGMAAVFAPLAALLRSGDEVLASRSVFGSTHQILTQILPRWGIGFAYADIHRPETWEQRITPNTRACYVETPSNPTLDLIDLDQLAALCRSHGIHLIVDNIFATPILQKPIRHGADLVMHSATKYIDGQGRGIGGVVVGRKDLIEEIRFFTRHTGPSLSPFNAWMFSKSIETLALRMERHCENALQLARFLETHAEIAYVKYPYLPSHPQHTLAMRQMKAGGGIVTFGLKGGLDQGRRFLDALELCSLTANLGDARTIATHPASTTHSSLSADERAAVGIDEGLVRISVGLEYIGDVITDIDRALSNSR